MERSKPNSFVHGLKHTLLDEAQGYAQSANTMGIPLSCDMDARMLAGLVRALQEGPGETSSVLGMTLGREIKRTWSGLRAPLLGSSGIATTDSLEEVTACLAGPHKSWRCIGAMGMVRWLNRLGETG